jgi:small basic protein (TIGR04137 family)
MSRHPSLRATKVGGAFKNVQKRFERVRIMLEKKEWEPGQPVFGLPKLKQPRVKVAKKSK